MINLSAEFTQVLLEEARDMSQKAIIANQRVTEAQKAQEEAMAGHNTLFGTFKTLMKLSGYNADLYTLEYKPESDSVEIQPKDGNTNGTNRAQRRKMKVLPSPERVPTE